MRERGSYIFTKKNTREEKRTWSVFSGTMAVIVFSCRSNENGKHDGASLMVSQCIEPATMKNRRIAYLSISLI